MHITDTYVYSTSHHEVPPEHLIYAQQKTKKQAVIVSAQPWDVIDGAR